MITARGSTTRLGQGMIWDGAGLAAFNQGWAEENDNYTRIINLLGERFENKECHSILIKLKYSRNNFNYLISTHGPISPAS
jgi:hypothetical protein